MEGQRQQSQRQGRESLNTMMSTGALARRAACSTQHVRNLEREGVLPSSTRAANGYRTFTQRHLHALLAYQQLSTAIGPLEAKRVLRELTGAPSAVAARTDELHAGLHAERTALHRAIAAARAISGEPMHVREREDAMTIGELARALAVRTSTLRHWEHEGLLTPGRRDRARCYSPADVRDARIVDQLRRAGYRIPDLRELMVQLRGTGGGEQVRQLLERRSAALDVRSRALLAAGGDLLALTGAAGHP